MTLNSSISAYWRACASGVARGPLDRLLVGLLLPLGLLYGLIQRLRAWSYLRGVLASRALPRPVISIGNISVGGTGKTPVAAYIARRLMEQGFRVAVLSRGYGGSREGSTAIVSDGRELLLTAEECGDEPYLLASMLPGLMVVIGSDRHAAGQLALERLQPDLFLLDDGFQHLRLRRDLNILLLDAVRPYGNGFCLPAGLLREPISAQRRADLIIRTRCPAPLPPATPLTGIPVCHASHALVSVRPMAGGKLLPLASLQGQRLLAFAGIAEPQPFFDGLRAVGLNLVVTRCLPDHASYTPALLEDLAAAMTACGAAYAITTEKDGVKLQHLPPDLAGTILLTRLELRIHDPLPLDTALRNLLQK